MKYKPLCIRVYLSRPDSKYRADGAEAHAAQKPVTEATNTTGAALVLQIDHVERNGEIESEKGSNWASECISTANNLGQLFADIAKHIGFRGTFFHSSFKVLYFDTDFEEWAVVQPATISDLWERRTSIPVRVIIPAEQDSVSPTLQPEAATKPTTNSGYAARTEGPSTRRPSDKILVVASNVMTATATLSLSPKPGATAAAKKKKVKAAAPTAKKMFNPMFDTGSDSSEGSGSGDDRQDVPKTANPTMMMHPGSSASMPMPASASSRTTMQARGHNGMLA